jgi:hypothetical protein
MRRLIYALLMFGIAATALGESPQNPPPTNVLSGYDKYELLPIAMGAPYAGDEGKEKQKTKIQDYMTAETNPIIAQWNTDAAGSARGQSLVIEPRIERLKVVSGGSRFWIGPLAGDSYVVMKVRIVEQPSGTQLAEPEFYQRASAMSGSFTIGAQDKDMLHRVVVLVDHYLQSNYKEAVGGATGYDAK